MISAFMDLSPLRPMAMSHGRDRETFFVNRPDS
jgi:hypothetical protein